ncbi:MAG: hypothetical protein AAFY91_11400 [Bacteroidota bacterium]
MNRPPNSSNRPPEHLLGPIRSIYRRRKHLLLLAVGTFVLTFLVTKLFIPDYYEATTSFIALSPDQSSPELFFGGQNKPQIYGNSDDIDRLLAISESNDLVDYMISTFKLYKHYGIDSTKRKAPVSVRREFFSLYEVTKTPRDAIEISVLDTSPQVSADMANAARERIGFLSRELQRNAQGTTMETLRQQVDIKRAQLKELNDSLANIRENSGIYNHVAQSEALGEMVSAQDQQIVSLQAIVSAYEEIGTRAARDSVVKYGARLEGVLQSKLVLDSQLVLLNGAMSVIENLNYDRANLNSQINRDLDRMKQFQTAYESNQKALAIIQQADIPVIKAWPRRSVIVLGATILVVFMAVLTILVVDNGQKYPWQEWLTEDE